MRFTIILALIFSFSAFGQAEPLKFKGWKEQQILEAQNEVLRLNARLRQAKVSGKNDKSPSSKYTKEELMGGAGRFEKANDINDKDLKRAQENLEIAKELNLEDYTDVYVTSVQQNPEQFSKLMDSLSKEELAELMKILVKVKTADRDAKRNTVTPAPSVASSTPRS